MCGIFGVSGHPDAAALTHLGLYALQHRGQESAGIVAVGGGRAHGLRAMGLVGEKFGPEALQSLPGSTAVGHTRYSTAGSSTLENAQPALVNFKGGHIALAHNGNLVNATEIRAELESHGSIFSSTMDSEVIVHRLALGRRGSVLAARADQRDAACGARSTRLATAGDGAPGRGRGVRVGDLRARHRRRDRRA